ncbi:MAG: Asp-tRNA(Asn)/Glu-tRNA(Gln) amidotransferase subunit GatB [Nanoarchaeota archaeon]|nr:Asp-tRNA(Asn)/Glu-tRNA(Gln) amidotransferase subunit GatB [Nanoarchaeota archaeon]
MNKVKIGIEVHIQLNTKSKLFCGCSTDYKEPNSVVCETCLGMPGSKPRLNQDSIIKGIKLALALNCKIQDKMLFSRKTYFYPDLSKNYQITQYENPLAKGGFLKVKGKKIRITRLQIEEDPASIHHKQDYVLIDYNRSGVPLLELVTEPDFENVEEVIAFLDELTTILDYLDMYDPKSFTLRADVNVSIDGNPRVEIKNLTGSKSINKALNFEIVRQKSLLSTNQEIKQQTMHFDADKGSTFVSREKESEEDYGYIFDPDLPVVEIQESLINEVKEKMPELPQQKIQRFVKEYGMRESDAYTITLEKSIADLFEAIQKDKEGEYVIKWMTGPLRKVLNYNNLKFTQTGVKKEQVVKLLNMIKKGTLTPRSGELVLRDLIVKPKDPEKIMKKLGFDGVKSADLKKIVDKVISANGKAVKDYKNGEKKSLQFLVGQVIRKTKGQADAKEVAKLLISKLK